MITNPVSRGETRLTKAQLHSLINSDIGTDVLRDCIKNWDARRHGMRESLPGDKVR